MAEVSLDEWNSFLMQRPEAHVLQTGEWGQLKSDFDWEAVRLIQGEMGIQILFRRLALGVSMAYVPKPLLFMPPPMASSGRSSQLAEASPGNEQIWSQIEASCRRRRAAFCKLEADNWDDDPVSQPPPAWSLSPHSIQPRRTIIVDIRGSEEDILARMKQKTRYNIRLAAKQGVTVRTWDDIAGFHRMMLLTGRRDGFTVHARAYFERAHTLFHASGMCELLVAEVDGRPVATLMVFARGQRAWYLYGASTDEERSRMPTYALQWEAMRWARSRGCHQYDLWGVPDFDQAELEAGFESRSDGLWGVYRFKRGFGGELKRAAPARDAVLNRLLYSAYIWRLGRLERAL